MQDLWPKTAADSSINHARKKRVVEAVERTVFRCVVLVTLSAMSTTLLADDAATEKNIHFNIPQQRADLALTQFAEQADLTLVFPFDDVRERTANRLVGEYPIEDAVDLLLSGTGLTPTFKNQLVLNIATDNKSEPEGEDMNIKKKAGFAAFLAGLFSVSAGAQEPENTDETDPALEEIVVVGTHIRGVDNVGASSITFTREELDNSGYSTVEDFFQSLPQNLDEISADGVTADGVSRVASSNTQGVSSISLRGLGPGSTLVLLNGKRRPGSLNGLVVDISAIPLSMVERVEVVTGGRSAVYGSDAVAGVVNIVTRTELDGAETQVYYGEASAGGERFNFSQTFGRQFEKGGFVLGYDYRDDRSLDATEAGVVRAPSIVGVTPLPGLFDLRLTSEQHVGLFAGHFELSDKAELYADAQFSADKNENGRIFDFLGLFEIGALTVTDSDQYSGVAGVRLDVGKDWQVDVSALHGVVDNTMSFANLFAPAGTFTSFDVSLDTADDDEAKLTSFSVIADGPLRALGNGSISAAIGIDFRDESYQNTRIALSTGTRTPGEKLDREIWSVFGEIHLPLINENGQRLEMSLAGRFDDYSDFGDTFNPQFGVEWEPAGGLTFRGSYAEAFRAPDLSTLARLTQVTVRFLDDPLGPPGIMTPVFSEFGGNPDLQPEEADTWTIGIDWEPSDRTMLSLSYFSIEYEGRIDQPADNALTALQDEFLYPGLINRNPTPQELDVVLNRLPSSGDFINNTGVPFDPATDDPFTVFPGLVYFDNRRNNIGLEAVDGLDIQASTVLETRSGDWSFDLSGTYYLDFDRNITVTSPTIEKLNQPGKPVDLKLRGGIGWSRSAWNVNAYVNYVDSYDDTIAATPTEIDSWTTVDLTLRYDVSKITDSSFLNGVKVTLGVNNAFDEDPPVFSSNLFGLGYDGANSNAIGRFVSLRLAKRW